MRVVGCFFVMEDEGWMGEIRGLCVGLRDEGAVFGTFVWGEGSTCLRSTEYIDVRRWVESWSGSAHGLLSDVRLVPVSVV